MTRLQRTFAFKMVAVETANKADQVASGIRDTPRPMNSVPIIELIKDCLLLYELH